MTDPKLQWVATITTGLLAVILIGGSVAGWLEGRDLPQWLATADGAIILGAFGSSAFFAVGRAGEAGVQQLQDVTQKYHQLAMTSATGTTPASPMATGQKAGD